MSRFDRPLRHNIPPARLAGCDGMRFLLGPMLLLALACKGSPAEAPDATAADPEPSAMDPQASPAEPTPTPPAELEAAAPAPRPARTIYRSELVRVTQFGPAYLLRQLGPEPFRYGGRFVGWEITRLFPDDPEVCVPGCDLQDGDVVLSVNGSRLETPQQLSDEFDKVPERTQITIVLLRDERRRSVDYRIVEDLR